MAITINGTGSITGLTAGGLPDGSVTAADIETSLDLTGKTVTLPSGTGGKVLQVVENSTTSESSTTSNSWQDSSLLASITPSSSSSKILIMMNAHIATARSSTNAVGGYNICRGSTIIWYPRSGNANGTSPIEIYPSFGNVNSIYLSNRIAVQMIDEPATTSQVTYKVQLASAESNNSCTVVMNGTSSGHNANSRFVLMEIAG